MCQVPKQFVAQYMNPECKDKPNQISQELFDQELIEENRALFWLVATVACEQSESGVIVLNINKPLTEGEYPFCYLTKGEIEYKDNRLERLLLEYDPHREFVIVISRSDYDFNVYLGKAPEIGWWDSISTR